MTSRAGAKQFMNRVARTFYDCTLLKVVRRDGVTVRITNHDRTLTFEGETYEPILLADLSAERREAALRSGNQEARTLIDGDRFTVPDLIARRWIGAEVFQVRTDWRMPWQWISRDRKWIRSANWTDGVLVCTFEARTQVLTRPAGGRFDGTFTTTCPYTLGDPLTCKKDVSIGSGFAGAGARVGTIVKQKGQVLFVVGTWPGTFVDGYFRDGSFEWKWGAPIDTGTVTATTGDNSLTDATQSWAVDAHVGNWVRVLTGTGQGVQGAAYAQIVSNTATTVFYATTAAMAGFTAGQNYDIVPECANAGTVSPIVYYTHATRDCTFLLPTPFDIEVGDSGIWRAGCDGLLTTCAGKFGDASHPLNFGGDPFPPSAQQVIEPAEGT